MNTDKSGEVRIASLSTLGEPMPETNVNKEFNDATTRFIPN